MKKRKKSKNSQDFSRATSQPLGESILNVTDGVGKRDVYDPPIRISQTQPTIQQQQVVDDDNLFPTEEYEFAQALNTNPVPVPVSDFQLPASGFF